MPRLPKALLPVCVSALIIVQTMALAFAQEAQEPGERDNAAARAEFHRSGRTAKGENAADLLHRAYQAKMVMREVARQKLAEAAKAQQEGRRANPEPATTPNFANLAWQSLGPSPLVYDPTGQSSYGSVTGRVSAVVADPNDPTGNTVYVGGASGGVWKSTNAASSDPNAVLWTPLTDDQPALAIGSIAVQPGGNVLLVGTGETNSSPDSYYGQGILRSTDGGHTWALIAASDNGTRSFRGLGFSKIAFSTVNSNIVVAAAASTNASSPGGNGGEIQGANGRGLYYSTDAGLTWNYASVLDPSGPTQAGSVGDVVYDAVFGKFYAVVRWHGYYSSVDGVTWTRLPNQPGAIDTSGLCPATTNNSCPEYRGSMSVRESTGELYTIFVDANANSTAGGGGIFVLSQDGGLWSQLQQAGIDGCGDPGTNSGCGTQQGTYNLYIKAVPNGSNTDLYVGAINIYKCSRTAGNLSCANANSWLNLTHVYGCSPFGAIAHVHPDQHTADFTRTIPIHMFFGNDGGVWRAQDETALTSSNCGISNPFDNVNSTLGSLSEFVSFSQHPTDPGTILGGLQDNGSPGLVPGNAGANGVLWQGLNDGDGGYNAIDPVTPSNVYSSNFNVSVQRCTAGTSCNQGSWSSVISSSTLGTDTSAFYPPFLLDPQNPNLIVIGTCRLWRGPANGVGTYTRLSFDFSTGSSTICTGSTSTGDSKVRSLAVGGPVTGNGSQVIYAGTVGAAPLNGHVFVTTSADSGVASWIDRTGGINPSGYDVSDITISPYDATGQTAYLAIMGFGTGHVFKTTNAGAIWADISANLPDIPANSVAVDPVTPGTVYAGTDIGVFVTIDDGATWAELGSGLPNAPVVKVKTFVSGNVKKLRAATYGRGMWQVDLPQADISFFSAPLAFAAVVGRTSLGQTVSLSNNSGNSVNIGSVTAGGDFSVSSGCPATLASGSSCPVTVVFSAHAAGASNGTLTLTSNAQGGTRTLQLNGQGVDFSLSALGPRPSRPQRNAAQTSGTEITMAHGDTRTVDLSLNVSNAGTLGTIPPDARTIALQCESGSTDLRCEVSPSNISLTSDTQTLQVRLTSVPARSKRLSRPVSQTMIVRVRASLGGETRMVELPVRVQ